MSNVTLQTLGSLNNAQAIAGRVERAVPAYRQFIGQREWTPGNPFPARPVMDKTSYLLVFPFDQLVGEDFEQTFTIFKSSVRPATGDLHTLLANNSIRIPLDEPLRHD